MQITFGKYQGWDTEDLAKAGEAGRSYLNWGADNLRSPKWRKEFSRALAISAREQDEWLTASAIVQDCPDIGYEDAHMAAREEIAFRQEWEREEIALENAQRPVLEQWAPILGVTIPKARSIAMKHEVDYQKLPASRFSSVQKHKAFLAFMEGWMACYD